MRAPPYCPELNMVSSALQELVFLLSIFAH